MLLNSELKLAKFATNIMACSYLIIVAFFYLLFGAVDVYIGRANPLYDPLTQKILVITVFYFPSIFLLASLPGKKLKRRAFSWLYSIAFHTVLLIYLGVTTGLGLKVLVLAIAETIVVVASIVGFYFLVDGQRKNSLRGKEA